MEPSIYRYIFRYSKREQLLLVVLTVISFPFLYLSLDLPKTIINKAIGGSDFPITMFGTEIDQIPYLLILCGIFLGLVFVNGGFKFYVNVFRGVVGERMLRRLRYQLVHRVLRFPLHHFRKTSQGEIVSMVTTETEPLGGFIGDALALPAFQGGTLLVIVGFVFVQDWVMGIAAIALFPVQGIIIPILQAQVNRLGKERVQNVRKLSERIGETASGAHEIHAHDTSQYELSDFSQRLGTIYGIRVNIYRKKFFIKFINNFINQLTPFFFFSIGGYLVIVGELTFGALVAVLAAYKDMASPWKELLTYYQRKEDARIKYGQLIDQFEPAGMFDESLLDAEPEDVNLIDVALDASNVTWEEDEGVKVVDGASLNTQLPEHMAIVGSGSAGTNEFAKLLARQILPSAGRIAVGAKNLVEMPESVTGRRIAYVGNEAYLASGTIRESLLYGLKHRPLQDAAYDEGERKTRESELAEAGRAGNNTFDFYADWVDYEAAGGAGKEELAEQLLTTLQLVELDSDVYRIGLRRTIDPGAMAELARDVMKARAHLRERLAEQSAADLVERFDKDRYNANATVAENILFGTPVGPTFAIETLGENDYVLQVLDAVGLKDAFLDKGHRLAEMMVEIFHDLPAGHEFFERFSFIESDDLPEFQTLLRRVEHAGLESLNDDDRTRLMALPFKIISARHQVDLVDDAFIEKILEARGVFAERLPEGSVGAVQLFDAVAYNAASSIQDNILFGKLATNKAGSAELVGELIAEVIDELGLRRAVIEVGLDYEIGIGGMRLSAAQRQKIAIARCMLKQPDLLIVNDAVSALDSASRASVFKNVRDAMKGRTLIWVGSEVAEDSEMSSVFSMAGGKIVAGGRVGGVEPAPAEAAGAEAQAPAETPAERASGFGAVVGMLGSIPLFSGMDRSKLKLLGFTSERVSFEAGQTVFRQGEEGHKAYVVVEGAADVILESAAGETRVAEVGANEIFGELALLCDTPRSATVRAKTPLTVLGISRDVFMTLLEENRAIAVQVTRAVASRLESTLRDYGRVATMSQNHD
jgi:ABC-type multidrug transport system fused ATPase/permease subunit